jgi:hypothetical protein
MEFAKGFLNSPGRWEKSLVFFKYWTITVKAHENLGKLFKVGGVI